MSKDLLLQIFDAWFPIIAWSATYIGLLVWSNAVFCTPNIECQNYVGIVIVLMIFVQLLALFTRSPEEFPRNFMPPKRDNTENLVVSGPPKFQKAIRQILDEFYDKYPDILEAILVWMPQIKYDPHCKYAASSDGKFSIDGTDRVGLRFMLLHEVAHYYYGPSEDIANKWARMMLVQMNYPYIPNLLLMYYRFTKWKCQVNDYIKDRALTTTSDANATRPWQSENRLGSKSHSLARTLVSYIVACLVLLFIVVAAYVSGFFLVSFEEDILHANFAVPRASWWNAAWLSASQALVICWWLRLQAIKYMPILRNRALIILSVVLNILGVMITTLVFIILSNMWIALAAVVFLVMLTNAISHIGH